MALAKANPNGKANSQLLRLTLEDRRKELTKVNMKDRIRTVMDNYPLFTKPQHIIMNMVLQLPETSTVMKDELLMLCQKVVDLAASKHLLKMPRASLINSDQVIAGGLMHMPFISGQRERDGWSIGPNKMSSSHTKKDEMLKAAIAEHDKVDGYFILQNKLGDLTTVLAMYKTEVLVKCKSTASQML